MTADYATERGSLLASMEHRCYGPGHWEVEGHVIRRLRRGRRGWRWYVYDGDGTAAFASGQTFTDVLRIVADKVRQDS